MRAQNGSASRHFSWHRDSTCSALIWLLLPFSPPLFHCCCCLPTPDRKPTPAVPDLNSHLHQPFLTHTPPKPFCSAELLVLGAYVGIGLTVFKSEEERDALAKKIAGAATAAFDQAKQALAK